MTCWLKVVELPDAQRRTRVGDVQELERIRLLKDRVTPEALNELWRVIVAATNTGLREAKLLSIERLWIREECDGWWLVLPPSATKLKGTPTPIPLNASALWALPDPLPSLADARVFPRWNYIRAFKKYWARVCGLAKIQDLHFHDLWHTFATRLQGLGVDYEIRQALLGHRMPGMTANYSHGGPAWDQKLRETVTKLDAAFKMSVGLSYERPAVAVGDPNLLKSGEPEGTRTQGPRLKSSNSWFLGRLAIATVSPILIAILRGYCIALFQYLPLPSLPFLQGFVTKFTTVVARIQVDGADFSLWRLSGDMRRVTAQVTEEARD
jgi:hypothetical protein